MYQLVRRCTSLQLLNLQGCRHIQVVIQVLIDTLILLLHQDEGVVELAESCPSLRYLCISNCVHLTDMTLMSLANHCKELVTLECAGVSQFTDAGFQVSSFIH